MAYNNLAGKQKQGLRITPCEHGWKMRISAVINYRRTKRRETLKFTHNKPLCRNYRLCPVVAITPGLLAANLASAGETQNVVQLQSCANSTDTPCRLIPTSFFFLFLAPFLFPSFGRQPACVYFLDICSDASPSPWKLQAGAAKE